MRRLLFAKSLTYDKQGRLVEEAYEPGIYAHSWYYTLSYYENGLLKRTKKTDIYTIEEKIYQNGQLIRLKIFDNMSSKPELNYVGDYQYVGW